MDQVIATINEAEHRISRISWGGILAGTLTAISVLFLLNLLGLGIGLTSIDPMTEARPFSGIGTGTIIWWVVSNFIAIFCGGLVAARMAGYPSNTGGGLHGFLSWALYAVLLFLFFTSIIGSLFTGMSNTIGSIFGGSENQKVIVQMDKSQERGQREVNTTLEGIKQEFMQLIRAGERNNVLPNDAAEETQQTVNNTSRAIERTVNDLNIDQTIQEIFQDLEVDFDEEGNLNLDLPDNKNYFDTQRIKQALAENTQLSAREIDSIANNWNTNMEEALNEAEQWYGEAKDKVQKYTEEASDAVGKYSIILFCMLVLGGVAGFLGGALGTPPLFVDEEHLLNDDIDKHIKDKNRR